MTSFCVIELQNGLVASVSCDTTIKICHTTTKTCIVILTGHSSWVQCILQLRNGYLVSGSFDEARKIWNHIV